MVNIKAEVKCDQEKLFDQNTLYLFERYHWTKPMVELFQIYFGKV